MNNTRPNPQLNRKPRTEKPVSPALTISIILLVIIIIALIIYGIIISGKGENEKTVIDTNTGKVIDPELVELYKMSEYERIKYYLTKYVKYIEEGKYQEAYNLLSKDFKEQHFKTLEDYTKYIQTKYLPVLAVQYDGVIRLRRILCFNNWFYRCI